MSKSQFLEIASKKKKKIEKRQIYSKCRFAANSNLFLELLSHQLTDRYVANYIFIFQTVVKQVSRACACQCSGILNTYTHTNNRLLLIRTRCRIDIPVTRREENQDIAIARIVFISVRL